MKTAPLFHPFRSDISKIALPEQFTYPFFYQPHPLTEAASNELQSFLLKGTLVHNFGLGTHESLIEQGKMFGVLVVKDSLGNLGWLAAYSGKLSEEPQGYFVPPVADIHAAQSFYKKGEAELNDMSAVPFALDLLLKLQSQRSCH